MSAFFNKIVLEMFENAEIVQIKLKPVGYIAGTPERLCPNTIFYWKFWTSGSRFKAFFVMDGVNEIRFSTHRLYNRKWSKFNHKYEETKIWCRWGNVTVFPKIHNKNLKRRNSQKIFEKEQRMHLEIPNFKKNVLSSWKIAQNHEIIENTSNWKSSFKFNFLVEKYFSAN